MRGDYKSPMDRYSIGIQNGFFSVNDVRRMENLDPITEEEGGDLYLTNGNMLPLKMAGDEVCVSPLSVIMIHNPAMLIAGKVADLQVGINLLSEVKESIINAYQTKSGLSRSKISHMMDAETYGPPKVLAKAMTAELSVELIEANLYADDGVSEVVKEFKSGALTLGIDDIGSLVAQDLTGCKIDSNNVVVSRSEDGGSPVIEGIVFRRNKLDAENKHLWECHKH